MSAEIGPMEFGRELGKLCDRACDATLTTNAGVAVALVVAGLEMAEKLGLPPEVLSRLVERVRSGTDADGVGPS